MLGLGALLAVCMAVVFLLMNSYRVDIFGIRVPIQLFGLLSLIPICLYSGQKASSNRWLQRGFYLFYPLHLLILLGVQGLAAR